MCHILRHEKTSAPLRIKIVAPCDDVSEGEIPYAAIGRNGRYASTPSRSSRPRNAPLERNSNQRLKSERTSSRCMAAMAPVLMRFGQTASHSPSFEHPPKPSAMSWSTMREARMPRSGCP